MTKSPGKALGIIFILSASGGGCVQRTLTVRSDPPGALVYMNDQEIGRTPVTRNFLWYGTYDVELRLAGYESVKTTAAVTAPWWQWVPFDLFAEAFAVTDHHDLRFTLRPPTDRQEEPELLAQRGQELRGELQSTQRTAPPATRPHKKRPATQPSP